MTKNKKHKYSQYDLGKIPADMKSLYHRTQELLQKKREERIRKHTKKQPKYDDGHENGF